MKETAQAKKKAPSEQLRERKILLFQERIAHCEKAIAELEERRDALAATDVTGLTVSHKTFGKGTVTKQSGMTITVSFDFGEKRFIMPSAFTNGFLSTENTEIGEKLSQYPVIEGEIKRAKEDMHNASRAIQSLLKQ
ncbi:MAG: hypothetical protein ACI4SJ_02740 [Candidatus Avispirillum sp.]